MPPVFRMAVWVASWMLVAQANVFSQGSTDIEVIGILRGGIFVTNGERWDGGFPSLPNC